MLMKVCKNAAGMTRKKLTRGLQVQLLHVLPDVVRHFTIVAHAGETQVRLFRL